MGFEDPCNSRCARGRDQEAVGGLTTSAAITFSGAATLLRDDSVHFSGRLDKFTTGNFLDLADIAFTSATTLAFTEAPSNTSGTLTVSDGIHTANILLLGQYATAQFNKNSDGHGGTVITDPPLTSSTTLAAGGFGHPHF